jgi:hypothetical protein
MLRTTVVEPWIVSASDKEITLFLQRNCDNATTYEDLRDHFLFNFNDADDVNLFLREVRCAQDLRVNVCLFGTEYLENNE